MPRRAYPRIIECKFDTLCIIQKAVQIENIHDSVPYFMQHKMHHSFECNYKPLNLSLWLRHVWKEYQSNLKYQALHYERKQLRAKIGRIKNKAMRKQSKYPYNFLSKTDKR